MQGFMPLLPLRGMVAFPNTTAYIDVGRERSLAALESAKGYIRRELGKRLKTRIIPELFFHVEESIAYGVRMMKVIEEQIAADEKAAEGRPPEDPEKYVKA